MLEGKKGLRLLSLSIVLQIIWTVVAVILTNKVAGGTASDNLIIFVLNYLPVITAAIAIVCFLIDFAGLRIAGHDNDRFKKAWKLKILSLLFSVFAVIFAAVAVSKDNVSLMTTATTIAMIANIFAAVVEVLVILLVAKGCAELAPRAERLSKVVLGLFFIQTVLAIVIEVLNYIVQKGGASAEGAFNAACYVAIAFLVIGIVFAVLYILLILKATRNVGKAKR